MNILVRNTYECRRTSRETNPEVHHDRRTGTAPTTSTTLPRLPTACAANSRPGRTAARPGRRRRRRPGPPGRRACWTDRDEGPHHRRVAASRTRGVLAARDVRLPPGDHHQGGGRHL